MPSKKILVSLIVLAVAGWLGYSLTVALKTGAPSAGIVTCVNEGDCILTAHMHAFIPITICNERLNLAIEKGALTGPHTHEERNIIHWHDKLPYDSHAQKVLDDSPLTLKAFFEQIGIPFSRSMIAATSNDSLCDGIAGSWKMFVNSTPSDDFEKYIWQDRDVIELIFDSRSAKDVEADVRAHPVAFPTLGRG